MWRDPQVRDDGLHRLRDAWGPTDYEGTDRPFDVTDYYSREMGSGLQRRIIAFRDTICPSRLATAKRKCNQIEDDLADNGRRRINLDVGTLDLGKIVLASYKDGGRKIYLQDGVYADCVALYQKGRFEYLPWTFPDISDGRYEGDFIAIRLLYRRQLRRRG